MLVIGQIFLIGAFDLEMTDRKSVKASARRIDYIMQSPKRANKIPPEHRMLRPKLAPKLLAAVEEENKLLGANLQDEKLVALLELDFQKRFEMEIVNHHGKFLRIRLKPAIMVIPPATAEKITENFQKFSIIYGSSYSEFSIWGFGNVFPPAIGTSPTDLPRLMIPFKKAEESFLISRGKEIAPGLRYYKDRATTKPGKADVHILRFDASSPKVLTFPVLANEGICQKEVLSSMGKRYQALAGINGAYFTHRGDPIGTLIISRKLISSPLYSRSVFGLTNEGKPIFGNPDFSGSLICDRVDLRIDAVNQPRAENSLVIFTPEYARSTLTSNSGTELVIVKNRVVGIHTCDTLIPPDGVVVSAGGRNAKALSKIRLGDQIELDYKIHKPWDNISHAVCGGPRLVKNGKVDINGTKEKFSYSITNGRHPRTAIAETHDGELLFLVVDGRSKRNTGMTLKELAQYLVNLGAQSAINMDGGGSSSMFVNNRIVNQPSDGKERPISNGILFASR